MTPTDYDSSVYRTRYGCDPKASTRAPGRVEILGNHTDYNGGFVLTVAIDKSAVIQGESMPGSTVTLYSEALDKETEFPIDRLERDPAHPWANYLKGVLVELKAKGIEIGGFRAVVGGDLPIGAGVSSSAALELATALFIQAIYPYTIEPNQLAKVCQAAENNFVGMPCGIMDQFSSLFGKKDSFLRIDCRDLSHESITVQPPAPRLVLCASGVKHELVESEYKIRRQQCETASQTLGNRLGRPVRDLRDISVLDFVDSQDILDDVLRRRVRHVVYENQRVLQGVDALKENDIGRLGELMVQSHESSRDNFENSCPELDWLVEESKTIPGWFGAKLTGGGFGGSTVNLVEPDKTDAFVQAIQERFNEKYGHPCETLECSIGSGAEIL